MYAAPVSDDFTLRELELLASILKEQIATESQAQTRVRLKIDDAIADRLFGRL
jgi:hypothetical protein